jgi:hypothetical protein
MVQIGKPCEFPDGKGYYRPYQITGLGDTKVRYAGTPLASMTSKLSNWSWESSALTYTPGIDLAAASCAGKAAATWAFLARFSPVLMIRDARIAKQVSDLMIEFSGRLDGSIATVREQCSPEEFAAYRRDAARVGRLRLLCGNFGALRINLLIFLPE